MSLLPTLWNGSLANPMRLLDEAMNEAFGAQARRPFLPAFAPALDIVERDDAYALTLEVPGIDPKDLSLEVANGVLTISGEKKSESAEAKDGYRHLERRWGSFSRSIRLDPAIDAEKLAADVKNGVLTVTLPKAEAAKPRKIEVRVQG